MSPPHPPTSEIENFSKSWDLAVPSLVDNQLLFVFNQISLYFLFLSSKENSFGNFDDADSK